MQACRQTCCQLTDCRSRCNNLGALIGTPTSSTPVQVEHTHVRMSPRPPRPACNCIHTGARLTAPPPPRMHTPRVHMRHMQQVRHGPPNVQSMCTVQTQRGVCMHTLLQTPRWPAPYGAQPQFSLSAWSAARCRDNHGQHALMPDTPRPTHHHQLSGSLYLDIPFAKTLTTDLLMHLTCSLATALHHAHATAVATWHAVQHTHSKGRL